MNFISKRLLFLIQLAIYFGTVISKPLVDYVDPFIGSGGQGFGAGSHNPGAQVPFGILRLGPDVRVFHFFVIIPN
jgi:putative alpha-1,2-mannosidase